jgi:hypothetical protein
MKILAVRGYVTASIYYQAAITPLAYSENATPASRQLR